MYHFDLKSCAKLTDKKLAMKIQYPNKISFAGSQTLVFNDLIVLTGGTNNPTNVSVLDTKTDTFLRDIP